MIIQISAVVYNWGVMKYFGKKNQTRKSGKFMKILNYTNSSCTIFCPKMFQYSLKVCYRRTLKNSFRIPQLCQSKSVLFLLSRFLASTNPTIFLDAILQTIIFRLSLSLNVSCFSKLICQAKSLTRIKLFMFIVIS